jgi:hypothetical protein
VPLLLGGVGFFLYTLFHELVHMTDSLTQVVVPGRVELSLKGGEEYTIFLERQSVINGMVYVTESINGLQCRVRSIETGRSVAVTTSAGASYSLGSRSGQSILAFQTSQDGRYEMACDYDGNTGPKAVLAVGTGIVSGILRTVLVSILSMFVGIGGCVAVVLTVIMKRRRPGERLLGTY